MASTSTEGPGAVNEDGEGILLNYCANCQQQLKCDKERVSIIYGLNANADIADHQDEDNPVPVLKAMSLIYGFPLGENRNQNVTIWRKDDHCALCEECGKAVTDFYHAFQKLMMLAHEASYISQGLMQLRECLKNAFSTEEIQKRQENVDNHIKKKNVGKRKKIVTVTKLKTIPATVEDDGCKATKLLSPVPPVENLSENVNLLENDESAFDLGIVKVETILGQSEQCQNVAPTLKNIKRKKDKVEVPVACTSEEEILSGTTQILSENGKMIRASTRIRKIKTPGDLGENQTPKLSMKGTGRRTKSGTGNKTENINDSTDQQQTNLIDQHAEISPTKIEVPETPDKVMIEPLTKVKPRKLSLQKSVNKNAKKKSAKIKTGNLLKTQGEKTNNLQKKDKQYKCEHCDKKFNMKATFEKHLASHEKQGLLCRCTVCDQVFPTVVTLTRHITSVHEANKDKQHQLNYPCTKCPSNGPSFPNESELKSHFENIHHINLSKFCTNCDKSFSSADHLIRHYKSKEHLNAVKTEKDLFILPDGDVTKDSPNDLNTSSERNVEQSVFKCNQCNKLFKRKHQLNMHILFHNETEPRFGCSQCPKMFLQPNALRDHILVHTSDSPLICNQCGKVFGRRDHYKRHMDVVHDENRTKKKRKRGSDAEGKSEVVHSCAQCQKTFSRKEYLRHHMRIHTGEKPHVCDLCGKQFRDPRNLAQHLITHKTDRPFCCSVCGLTFKRAHHLNDHEGTHRQNVARPFVCAQCGKAFKLRKHLISHELVHTGSKDHRCHVCGRAFSRKDNLQQHINKLHGKKLAEDLLVVVEEQRERYRQSHIEQQQSTLTSEDIEEDLECVLEEAMHVTDNGRPSMSGEKRKAVVVTDQVQNILHIIPTEVVTTLAVPFSTIIPTSGSTKFTYP